MRAPPFIQFYPADYLKDTNRLTTQQHGAYFLLILEYWVNGGLPDDDEQLATIARLTPQQWAKDGAVLARFFGPGWVHARIERDLAKAQEKNTRRVEAGKAGADARHTQGNRTSNANEDGIEPSIAGSNAPGNVLASSSDIHKEEDISLRSISSPRKPKSTKSPIEDGAQPTDVDRAHAGKVGMSTDVFRLQWQKFRDHHIAKGSRFASWPAAWRTWCANWVEYGGNARAGPASNPGRRSVADLAAMNLQEPGICDDDQRVDARHGASKSASTADQTRSGFAGRLSEPAASFARRGALIDQ